MIGLWIFFLSVNGIIGLASHAVDLSSPVFDVGFTILEAVVVIVLCYADRSAIRPLLTQSGFTDETWWYPVVGLIGIAVFMYVYFWGLGQLGAETMGYLEDYSTHGWPFWSALILISICPAVFEELAFRGFIMSRLRGLMKPTDALILQAAMFSVLHMLPLIFVSHFVVGLVLGFLRMRTGSLYPGIFVHMLWNAWVLVEEAATVG